MLVEKIKIDNSDFQIYDADVDNKVLVNTNTVNWLKLNKNEMEVFKTLVESDVSKFDEIAHKDLLLKLLVNNILQFKSSRLGRIRENRMRVYFAPTPYCNLKCVYCYAEAGVPKEQTEFDLQETFSIIDKFTDENVSEVIITGGEPLMRKDLFDLVDYIKYEKQKKVSILTNGILINKGNVEQFRKFEKVTLSLDASNAEINDITRGKGTFDKIIKSVRLLKENSVRVGITSVVSTVNLENVSELLRFIREELDIPEHKVAIHVAHGRGKSSRIECNGMQIKEFRDKYLEDFMETGQKEKNTSLFEPKIARNVQRQMCGVASAEIYVNERGEVYPCRLFVADAYKLGNLKDNTLMEIINNETTKNFKEGMKVDSIESCSKCEVKYLCGGGCRSSHACYTDAMSLSHAPLCNLIKNDIRSSILMENNVNPITLERIERGNVEDVL